MAIVTYDDRSFMIDGQRVWLVSGSIHYFRVPSRLWADRLLKAKRAGLNCISTYVAWNFHEPQEGKWEFKGDHDVLQFVKLAQELGLYVILRPGPYICAEWDFGGLPGWLAGRSGIGYRTNNAAFMHYFDKYFAQVLPRLAEQQVTRGGNIILIQNENEYPYTTMPDRTAYLDFISQLFRRSGFTIPIISCNIDLDPQTGCFISTDPPIEDCVECINTWDSAEPSLRHQRLRKPSSPLLVTEFWSGWFDGWGQPHKRRDAQEVARRALEILGCGAQFNYYMFHGGTNFGFWGSRLPAGPNSFQTTSYDYDAPIAEGGGLTEKYYFLRLVNLLASSCGPYFATSHEDESRASLDDSTDVLNLTGANGRWAVVSNHGRRDIQSVTLCLPMGRKLSVNLAPFGAVAIPFDLRLSDGHELNYSSLMPLGLFGPEEHKILVLHGPADAKGVLSIDGKNLEVQIPSGDMPMLLEHQGTRFILVHTDLAMRTWRLPEALVFGPAFVGADLEDIHQVHGAKEYYLYAFDDGKLHPKKIKPQTHSKPVAPRLGSWKRLCIAPEPVSKKLNWQKMDRPKDVDRLGLHYGYVWYRIDMEQDRPRKRYLFLPECADRASLYLNGGFLGVWGVGEEASREPIEANFKKGPNALVALVDNLGRLSFSDRIGELKGIFGHIWDAKKMAVPKFKLTRSESFPKRVVPRALTHLAPRLESLPIWTAETSFLLNRIQPIHLTFRDIPHHVAIFCNDRPASFFACSAGMNWGDVTLGAELKKGRNVIRLILWGDVDAKSFNQVKFFALNEPVTAGAKWSYRPWGITEEKAPEPVMNKGAWFSAKFKYSGSPLPLFVKLYGAKKGQMYLNGQDLGRFWSVGPQEWYYLPSCWLQPENNLVVFEEHGHMPTRCTMEYRPLGPFNS